MKRVLIANRGAIARRLIRSIHAMGYESVALYSDADANLPYVTEATHAFHLGGAAPKDSYLNIQSIIDIAKENDVWGIHPGYGFVSENADFVRLCEESGIVFIGPNLEAMRIMGSKAESKELAKQVGVPTIPGSNGAVATLEEAHQIAETLGYPVLIKASAGGGGIGMTVVKKEKKLESAFEDARKKGASFFGDDTVLIEKLIQNPHHVEVQVLGDKHATIVHLFDRECSVQRRHQKLVEEAPSPFISAETRDKMCEAAVKLARAVNYDNAGTVEFVVDAQQNFYFLEMNTRLQVEHGITEMITGVDIVEEQIRVAGGEKLSFSQEDVQLKGHAFEVRVCAENPEKRFFPAPGMIEKVVWPVSKGKVRVDAGFESGDAITPNYDSMIAKLLTHGATRKDALELMRHTLAEVQWQGTETNLTFHQKVFEEPNFCAGSYDTSYVKDVLGLKV